MKTGNSLWWETVQAFKDEQETKMHFKEAEIEVFYTLWKRMDQDGMTQEAIREHFKSTFDIGHSAFYGRLRKAGMKYVT